MTTSKLSRLLDQIHKRQARAKTSKCRDKWAMAARMVAWDLLNTLP